MLEKWESKDYFYKYLNRCINRKKDFKFNKEDLNFYYNKYNKIQKYLYDRKEREIDLKRLSVLSNIISDFGDVEFGDTLKKLRKNYELSITSYEYKDTERLTKIQCLHFDRMLEDNSYYKFLSDKLIDIVIFLRNNKHTDLNIKKKYVKNDDMTISNICLTLLGDQYMFKYSLLK